LRRAPRVSQEGAEFFFSPGNDSHQQRFFFPQQRFFFPQQRFFFPEVFPQSFRPISRHTTCLAGSTLRFAASQIIVIGCYANFPSSSKGSPSRQEAYLRIALLNDSQWVVTPTFHHFRRVFLTSSAKHAVTTVIKGVTAHKRLLLAYFSTRKHMWFNATSTTCFPSDLLFHPETHVV
jgi:hypothetical protein